MTAHILKLLVVLLIIVSILSIEPITYGHLYDNGIQQWINKEEGVKIQFKYTVISLKFIIIISSISVYKI